MGQDIDVERFKGRDFEHFERCLRAETQVLHDLVERGGLTRAAPVVGLELEAWLIDGQCRPAPCNDAFLDRLGLAEVVAELAKFNFELNVEPQPLAGAGLARLGDELKHTWGRCRQVAGEMGLDILSIGSLPTLLTADLGLHSMSERSRYRALNEQILRGRAGRPIRLDIEGEHGDRLQREQADVMLEAAATSLQAHLQVRPEDAARIYNASLIVSAATVALGANSPFLFGHELWQESRIPLFEQALGVSARPAPDRENLKHVSFGSGYVGYSLLECFAENLERFTPLLPVQLDEATERMPHLRLHNGTIWRWNRPLVGFGGDGRPHLRIEHRPMAAGPSIDDMIANLAFYFGLLGSLASAPEPPELHLPFAAARQNFYAAARAGLGAELQWLDGAAIGLRRLILESLLEQARAGLSAQGVDAALAHRWLRIVEARTASGQTGAHWQRRFIARHGPDFVRLTREYAARQADGTPVHEWTPG